MSLISCASVSLVIRIIIIASDATKRVDALMLIPYLGFPESENLSHYHLLQYFDQIICNFDIKKAEPIDPAFCHII
jgi:hypothetical protein